MVVMAFCPKSSKTHNRNQTTTGCMLMNSNTMLQSAQKSKQYSFHNACKHIAHQHLVIFISHNLSWTTCLCLLTLSHVTYHNIDQWVHTSTLQQSAQKSKQYSFHNACKHIIYLEPHVYVYWSSITISTMQKDPHHCSVSTMLQSEWQLKPKSFHNLFLFNLWSIFIMFGMDKA